MSVDINTENLIKNCFQNLKTNQITNKIYKDYYENNVDSIMSDYAMQDARSNLKITTNFAKKFIRMEVGYSLGNSVTYISKSNNKSLIDSIDFNIGSWSKAQDQRLRKESEIYGVSYELDYVNSNGEFAATTLTSMNCYVLTDGTAENNVVMALHYFKKTYDLNDPLISTSNPKEFLDVYIENRIIHYNCTGGSLVYINEDTHIFDHVPIIITTANDEMQSGFYDIITLMKGYNNINSDQVNEISDFRNAYLKVTGTEIEEEDLIKMKKDGVMNIPDGGDASWLIKNLNDTFIKNALDNLENKIYDIQSESNLNKDFTSNTSSLAIKIKLTDLENKLAGVEALFEMALRQRLRNLSNYLKVKTGQGFDVRDLKIQFTRNLPSDLTSLAQAITQLSPIVSQRTLLSLLPFVNNVNAEMAQFKKEKSENMINLDNVPDNTDDNAGGAVVNE